MARLHTDSECLGNGLRVQELVATEIVITSSVFKGRVSLRRMRLAVYISVSSSMRPILGSAHITSVAMLRSVVDTELLLGAVG